MRNAAQLTIFTGAVNKIIQFFTTLRTVFGVRTPRDNVCYVDKNRSLLQTFGAKTLALTLKEG